MTNELEKQFFQCFGIEQKEHKECQCDYLNCPNPDIEECEECYYYKTYKFDYPQISDSILLELICILSRHAKIGHYTMDGLKRQLLNLAIIHKKNILEQVRALFEEGWNDKT